MFRYREGQEEQRPVRGSDTGLGVIVARRAGLIPAQILNARESADLVRTLAARKKRALTRIA